MGFSVRLLPIGELIWKLYIPTQDDGIQGDEWATEDVVWSRQDAIGAGTAPPITMIDAVSRKIS